jgi:ABC-2 type transport system ATP-binding protein
MRSLESPDLEVDDIALRQPTLDEVFLALTGHHVDTDDQAREKRAA